MMTMMKMMMETIDLDDDDHHYDDRIGANMVDANLFSHARLYVQN